MDPRVRLAVDAFSWRAIGDGDGADPLIRLATEFQIGNLTMRLEAIQIVDAPDGMRSALYRERDADFAALEEMEQARFATLEMNGRPYILFATPSG